MIVVLDTNVVIQALNRNHRFAIILDAWYAGRFSWAVSTDILFVVSRGDRPDIRGHAVAILGKAAGTRLGSL